MRSLANVFRSVSKNTVPSLLLSAAVLIAPNIRAEDAPKPPEPKPVAPDAPVAPTAAPAGTPAPLSAEDEILPTVVVTAPVVVTASRIEEPITNTGVSITVVDGREDREVHQNVQLAESLRQVQGVTISQSGLPGDNVSIFTRGGNSNHTLFLYDGFKVNRQGGGFDLGRVDAVQLSRVEIARGPASSLFGTDAVTGAINVITAEGEGRPELTVSGAGGTFGTDRETIAMQGNFKKFSYNVGAARIHRDEATFNNSELEAYNYAARFDYKINCDHSLKAILRGSDLHKGFYESTGSGFGNSVEPPDPNDQLYTEDLLAGLEYKGTILPIWTTTVKLGRYQFESNINSRLPNPDSVVFGFPQSAGVTESEESRPSLDWQNDITAFATECGNFKYVITAGANVEGERFDQKDTQFGNNAHESQTNWSVFLQNRFEIFNRAFVTIGARREENEQFGGFLTGRADVSIPIHETGTRIYGSVGNAFRAPSFFEYFSSIGNPSLEPEENRAYDFGLEQTFWKKRIKVSGTYFHNDFKDLVNFAFDPASPVGGAFENLSTAETRGFELAAEINPVKQLTLRGTGTLMSTQDDNGVRLLRRPGRAFTAQAIGRPIENLELSIDLQYKGDRTDIAPTGRIHLEGYTRVDAAASYRFLKHWRVFGRVENVLDENYEEVSTFPSPGSTVLAGVEFSWRF